MEVRRYLIYAPADLATMSGLAWEIVCGWANRWFVQGEKDVSVVLIEDGSELQPIPRPEGKGTYVRGAACEGRQIFCVADDELIEALCDSALGRDTCVQSIVSPRGRELEVALAGDIVSDIAHAFLGKKPAAGSAERVPEWPKTPIRRGAGWLRIVLAVGANSLDVWLNQAAVLRLHPIRIPDKGPFYLATRSAALTKGSLRIEVLAGEADISLSELFDLRPGQVIRLDTRFGEPLKLLSKSSDQAFAKGWLGLHSGKRAVQINAD